MIDFGLSKHFEVGQCHSERVGTPYTVAPEIILGSYDEKCDMWGKCHVEICLSFFLAYACTDIATTLYI